MTDRALVAAMVPSTPLLVPALAGGARDTDEQLRSLVQAVVRDLLQDAGPAEPVTVVGSAPRTGSIEGTWDWSGFGVPLHGAGPGPALPLALALGAWLIDQVDPGRPRIIVGVADSEDPAACRLLGNRLVGPGTTRLLVVGDGSARRTEQAPGHFDERAADFDEQVERALRAGDPQALLAVDAELAGQLMAAGRAPWQVLAGAAGGRVVQADVRYAEAPYGVGYLVACWVCGERGAG